MPVAVGAVLGLVVGFCWEGFGGRYLWTLASPRAIVFSIAMIGWTAIGAGVAFALATVRRRAPLYTVFLKPLIAPVALVTAKLTALLGFITYPADVVGVWGVPWYMVWGLSVLVYLVDDAVGWLLVYRHKGPANKEVVDGSI